MTLAIIGVGQVGQALARAWTRIGQTVLLGGRDAPTEEQAAFALQIGAEWLAAPEAAHRADLVVLALPWSGAREAVAGLGPLAGKVVIDCMNPLGQTEDGLGLTLGHTTSGAEQLAAWIPGARVVKTLNQVGAEIMADASGFPARPSMFMASDDSEAKSIVAPLLEAIGFEPLDAGGLRQARLLEPLAMVWINQAILRGKGRNWAFGAMERPA